MALDLLPYVLIGLCALFFVVKPMVHWWIERRNKKRSEKRRVLWPLYASSAAQAEEFQRCLNKSIAKMRADPSVTEKEWREFLLICANADEWYRATNPQGSECSKADKVRIILKRKGKEMA